MWYWRKDTPNTELFWSLVQKTEQCWVWQGRADKNGYARFGARLAYRTAYRLVKGIEPPGELMHLCDNRRCVNVMRCVVPGSREENNLQMAQGPRIAARRELTPEEALEARRLHAAGLSTTALAARFGVTFWCMRDVIRRKTFRWLKEAGGAET